jgi:hypothetical protein
MVALDSILRLEWITVKVLDEIGFKEVAIDRKVREFLVC